MEALHECFKVLCNVSSSPMLLPHSLLVSVWCHFVLACRVLSLPSGCWLQSPFTWVFFHSQSAIILTRSLSTHQTTIYLPQTSSQLLPKCWTCLCGSLALNSICQQPEQYSSINQCPQLRYLKPPTCHHLKLPSVCLQPFQIHHQPLPSLLSTTYSPGKLQVPGFPHSTDITLFVIKPPLSSLCPKLGSHSLPLT